MLDPLAPSDSIARAVRPLASALGVAALPLHAHEVAISFTVYNIIYGFVSPALSRRVFPNRYSQFDRRTRIIWNVRIVSQIQQTVVLSLAAYALVCDAERREIANAGGAEGWQRRIWGYDGLTGVVQALATGYFAWDVQVSAWNLRVLGVDSLAHGLGWLVMTVMGYRPFAHYYGFNFMLFELSTLFLNNNWFMDKLGLTGSRAQLVNGILLLVSFGGSRLVWGSYQTMLLFGDLWKAWNYVPSAACHDAVLYGADVPIRCRVLPAWLALLYVTGVTLLGLLNFRWYQRIVATVRKRLPKEKRAEGNGEAKKGR